MTEPITPSDVISCLDELPLVMNAEQTASLLQVSRSTLYARVSRGMYARAVKRGKPLLFHRDRLMRELFGR